MRNQNTIEKTSENINRVEQWLAIRNESFDLIIILPVRLNNYSALFRMTATRNLHTRSANVTFIAELSDVYIAPCVIRNSQITRNARFGFLCIQLP